MDRMLLSLLLLQFADYIFPAFDQVRPREPQMMAEACVYV